MAGSPPSYLLTAIGIHAPCLQIVQQAPKAESQPWAEDVSPQAQGGSASLPLSPVSKSEPVRPQQLGLANLGSKPSTILGHLSQRHEAPSPGCSYPSVIGDQAASHENKVTLERERSTCMPPYSAMKGKDEL